MSRREGINPAPRRRPTQTRANCHSPSLGDILGRQAVRCFSRRSLEHGELLLKYAAEAGIDVNDKVRMYLLQARHPESPWTEQTVDNLLKALTVLAARVAPVTVESLNDCMERSPHEYSFYKRVAIGLAAVIVPFSLVSFSTSALSNAITDIATANELAVRLTEECHRRERETHPTANP